MDARMKRNYTLNGVAVMLLGIFLFWASGSLDGYKIQILNLIAVNIILALSLNLIYGFTGLFSLGHAGFMAIGAYTCSLLILPAAHKQAMFLLQSPMWPFSVMHAPFIVAIVIAGLVAAFFGVLIGLPVLRLGGDYLGIATLGFAEIIRVLANNMPRVTNGALGLKGIPSYSNLWWNYGWCLITLFVIMRLVRSNFGNTLKAIRDDEVAARAMGIDTFRYRLTSFTIGAFFAGVGGALLASLLTTIDPKMFLFILTFNVLMIVVAGGLGSLTGTVLAGVVITVLLEWLRIVENPFSVGSITVPAIPGMRMVVFSLALLFIILFRQQGIMGKREFSWDWFFGLFGKRGDA
ncbi:MAG TPA: branched-chain amino acid ABC transporter permease [Synergistales bacterium]|nr:branched-chain amino acid ABC transporter permease [Synergistales bacterium]HRV70447.1 branched-chain amino acid ABC transporter permease [Thermovirgaceae bacterium]